MPRGDKDHGSNWLIQHQARSLLPIIGLPNCRSCKALHPRITLPQVIPDGLLEVELADRTKLPLLLEVESYPSAAHGEQIAKDMEMARTALGRLPDTVLVVLAQRGPHPQPAEAAESSVLGWSSRGHRWRVIEMRNVPANVLLESDDVGQMPLLPLTRSDLSPEGLVELARQRIEARAMTRELPTLLTVTAIMATLRFQREKEWMGLMGGRNILADSPLYQLWMEENSRETKHDAILRILRARFKTVPEELAAEIRAVTDVEKLDRAIDAAALCPTLRSFRTRLKKG